MSNATCIAYLCKFLYIFAPEELCGVRITPLGSSIYREWRMDTYRYDKSITILWQTSFDHLSHIHKYLLLLMGMLKIEAYLSGDGQIAAFKEAITLPINVPQWWCSNHQCCFASKVASPQYNCGIWLLTQQNKLNWWTPTKERILKQCGINRNTSNPKWLMHYYNWINNLSFPICIEQTSELDCSPIACRVLWQVFCPCKANQSLLLHILFAWVF